MKKRRPLKLLHTYFSAHFLCSIRRHSCPAELLDSTDIKSDTKKRELLKNPTKTEEIQEKKIIDRTWTITTCLLRDSNPNYECLKITYCRWRPPPRMHSFTATTHFKSSRLLYHTVCVACSAECDSVAFCRACNTHRVTQKNGNFWNA